MAQGNPAAITPGAGWLYVAPIGTTEPTDASAALPSAWKEVGYTESGHTRNTDITSEDIEVAESLDPVATTQTKRTITVGFTMVEMDKFHQSLAYGAGIVANDATGFEPPDPEDLAPVMLVHDSLAGGRFLMRKASVSGSQQVTFAKAPAKPGIAVVFNAEDPGGGLKPVKHFPKDATGAL
jgi:hypothetical protein